MSTSRSAPGISGLTRGVASTSSSSLAGLGLGGRLRSLGRLGLLRLCLGGGLLRLGLGRLGLLRLCLGGGLLRLGGGLLRLGGLLGLGALELFRLVRLVPVLGAQVWISIGCGFCASCGCSGPA